MTQRNTQALFSKLESKRSTKKSNIRINRKAVRNVGGQKRTSDQELFYEIFDSSHDDVISGSKTPDNRLVQLIKNEINESHITREDLHQFIGEDGYFKDKNQVYNLDYGLKTRSSISFDCAEKWLALLGKELVLEVKNIND
jgi:hypothetical protein